MSVALRQRKQKSGNTSLLLDIYIDGKRSYEFLKLHLVEPKDELDRKRNKEVMLMAREICVKRELELSKNRYQDVLISKEEESNYLPKSNIMENKTPIIDLTVGQLRDLIAEIIKANSPNEQSSVSEKKETILLEYAIFECRLSIRARNCLRVAASNITKSNGYPKDFIVHDLAKYSRWELENQRNLGTKTMKEIDALLAHYQIKMKDY